MIDDPTSTRYAYASDAALTDALLTLKPKHRLALDALARGATQAEAAEAAGVARETVTRWLNYHPEFRAAHALLVRSLAVESREMIGVARGKALSGIVAALDRPDVSVSDLVSVLRLVGLDTPSDTGPVRTAFALLDEERERTRLTCPTPPRGRELGDLMADLSGDTEKHEAARIDRLTLTRLAAASGIDPDDLHTDHLDPDEPA